MEFSHTSVLLKETIENLKIKPDGIYVDGTWEALDIPVIYVSAYLPRGD